MSGPRSFDQQIADARRLEADGRRLEAVRQYRRALATGGEPAPAEVWEECLALEAALTPGADQRADLQAVIKRFPLRERPVELLMLMYQRTGRRKEALDTYHRYKALLVIDSGSSPSERLRELHDAIQDEEIPTLDQLPADVTHFVGRAGVLNQLDEPAEVTVVTGQAGVGKTALAVHWANRMRSLFPGGQLYLNLRGYDSSEPVTAEDTLKTCLLALGVPPAMIPAPVQARATLFRSMLARRGVLVVLDNVASAKQVRPLLNPPRGSTIVITSRDPLRSLPDVRHVHLDRLAVDESYQLLKSLLGPSRVDAEPDATDALAWACGHLPLALRVVAAELVARPDRRITDAVTELAGGNTVDRTTAALDLAYARLPSEARTLLRHIGSAPGADVTPAAAAALLGAPADQPLATLSAAHLVTPYQPNRYRMHDLVRGYATARSSEEDDAENREAAIARWLNHLTAVADAAGITLSPSFERLARPQATMPFPDGQSASAWLAEEHQNLMAAIAWAHDHGHDTACVHLVDALRSCFWLTQDTDDWMRTGVLGLASAERLGDLRFTAAMHCNLGGAAFVLGRAAEWAVHCDKALELFERLDDWAGTTTMLLNRCLGFDRSPKLSVTSLERTIALGIEHDCVDTQILALGSLAINQIRLGTPRTAIDTATRCLGLAPPGNLRMRSLAMGHLGWAYIELGDLERAQTSLHEALELSSATGNRLHGLYNLTALGMLSLRAGDADRAIAFFRLVLDEAEKLGARRRMGFALCGLAEALVHTDSPNSLMLADRAVQIHRDMVDLGGEASALVVLATVHLVLGDLTTAAELAESATALTEQHDIVEHHGRALRAKAAITLAKKDYSQAQALASQALALHRSTGQRLHEVEDLMLLAEVLRQSGDEQAADQYETEASQLCRETAGPHAPDVLHAAWVSASAAHQPW